jgi:hypothetical protein
MVFCQATLSLRWNRAPNRSDIRGTYFQPPIITYPGCKV